jgi:cytochrome c
MGFEMRKGLAAAGLATLVLAGCGGGSASDIEKQAAAMTGGEPARGKEAIQRYACATCHVIPGVEGAKGQVGPSLEGIGSRPQLSAKLPNTPANLIRWIREPQDVLPGTAMPVLGVTEQDGKDIAAYLYTLRK